LLTADAAGALPPALTRAIAACFEAKTPAVLESILGHTLAPFGLLLKLAVSDPVTRAWCWAGIGNTSRGRSGDWAVAPLAAVDAAHLLTLAKTLTAPELVWPAGAGAHAPRPTALVVPLDTKGERRGALAIAGPGLSATAVPLLEPFGALLGLAVEQVLQQTDPQLDHAHTALLLKAGQAIAEVTELDQVLQVICRQALRISGGVTAALLTPDADGAHLRCVMATGSHSDLLLGQRAPLASTAVGRAFGEQIELVVDAIGATPLGSVLGADAQRLQSGIYVGLQAQGRVNGVLGIWHTEPYFFGPRQERAVLQFAVNAAVALDNAGLHEAMRRSEERYRTLFQNALEIVMTLDLEGRLVSWNRAALQFLGVSPAELRGGVVKIDDLIMPQQAALMAALQARALEGHAVVPTEIEMRRPGGTTAFVELTVQLFQEGGQPQGVYLIGRDMTERRHLEAQVHQGEKLAALGQLVAGAAHELNNPLAVVLGTTQLLLRDPLAAAFGDDVRSIEAAAQRAKHIVKQMLTFARKHQEERGCVELAPLVERVLASLQPKLNEHAIVVERVLAADLPPIWGDVYQLEQVLDNLLHNAVHALAESHNPRRIRITAVPEGKLMRVSVADNGPGMAPQVLSRIFDPFFTTKAVGSGTGLGLSLVFGIVDKHGGSIRAESAPGQGAVFVVELPLSEQRSAPEVDPQSAAVVEGTILIVEDEFDVRLILGRALAQVGYHVEAVESAEAAIAELAANCYDLVITDMRMPGMSGRELFEQVRATQPDLRWVFVTGDTMIVSSETFLKQTGVPFLPKPFSLEELWTIVASSTARPAPSA
jgi:two-component system NtrC family sensor kinase